jgi:hypothetical protein
MSDAIDKLKGPDMTPNTEAQKHAAQMRKAMCGRITDVAKKQACEARIQVNAGRRKTRARRGRKSRRRITRRR